MQRIILVTNVRIFFLKGQHKYEYKAFGEAKKE